MSTKQQKNSGLIDDVRNKVTLAHGDVLGLNFIRAPGSYFYRRHYRAGLRSHILEVIKPEDLIKERKGVLLDGLRWFPRSKPFRMLRIFRTHFNDFQELEEETERVKIVARYLGKGMMAMSQEFVVDYREGDYSDIMLCGLQEYIEGEVLDPWGHMREDNLIILLRRMLSNLQGELEIDPAIWISTLKKRLQDFCRAVKKMILDAGYIPDLAGVGNLLVTEEGDVKLVDINNISRVYFSSRVYLDDKGYPVCDKSIQALSMIEEKLLGKNGTEPDIIYKRFLDYGRVKEVAAIESEFHSIRSTDSSYPADTG